MSFYARIKSSLKKNLTDRYIIISGPRGNVSYRISALLRISVMLLLCLILLWFCIVIFNFFSRKNSVDVVYEKMSELRSVNEELVSKIKEIDKDLSEFSKQMGHKRGSEKQGTKWKVIEDKSVLKKSEKIQEILNESFMEFTYAVNARIGFLLTTIHNLGLDPYKFIPESKNKLDKVRLSNVQIAAKNYSTLDLHRRRSEYYYYKPSSLFKTSEPSFVSNRVNSKKAFFVLKSLNGIFNALPINPPMSGRYIITSRYGVRSDPFSKAKRVHAGIDLVRSDGSHILSSGNGTVSSAGFRKGYGYTVDINHGYGIKTRYAHLKGITVNIGQKLKAGQLIGYQGKTGSRCKGSHLHYEVHHNDRPINPINYLYASGDINKNRIAYFLNK